MQRLTDPSSASSDPDLQLGQQPSNTMQFPGLSPKKRKLADTSSHDSDDSGSPGKKSKTSERRKAQYRASAEKKRAKAKRNEQLVQKLSEFAPALSARANELVAHTLPEDRELMTSLLQLVFSSSRLPA